MAKKKTATKKRPQDSTLRNVRAASDRINKLGRRLDDHYATLATMAEDIDDKLTLLAQRIHVQEQRPDPSPEIEGLDGRIHDLEHPPAPMPAEDALTSALNDVDKRRQEIAKGKASSDDSTGPQE